MYGESPAHAPRTEDLLRVLVHQRGREVERGTTGRVVRVEDAFFHVGVPGDEVSGPYPHLTALFQVHGRTLAVAGEGVVLEWEGWVLSRRPDGREAGPFEGFDEWVWNEADPVGRDPVHTGGGFGLLSRHIHHWEGLYFVTVDPLPALAFSFGSLDQALQELRAFPYLQLDLRDG